VKIEKHNPQVDGRPSSLFWAELPQPTGNQTYKDLVDSYDFVNEPLIPAKVRSMQNVTLYGLTEYEHEGGLCEARFCADREEVRERVGVLAVRQQMLHGCTRQHHILIQFISAAGRLCANIWAEPGAFK